MRSVAWDEKVEEELEYEKELLAACEKYQKVSEAYEAARYWNAAGISGIEKVKQDLAFKKLEIAAYEAYKEYHELLQKQAKVA